MSPSKKKSSPKKPASGGGPPRVAGQFVSPKTGQHVVVFAKKGETNAEAMARVRKHHEK